MKRHAFYRAMLFALAAIALSWTVFFGAAFWFNPTFLQPKTTAASLLPALFGHYLGMMGPAVAALCLWRVFETPARPAFRRGKLKFYVWSVAGLILLRGAALVCGMFAEPQAFQWRAANEPYVWLVLGASLTVGWVAGLGEEVGWCAYLLPLLEPAFGKTGAVIFSGALRGVWHLPVILLPLFVQVMKNEMAWDFFVVNAILVALALVLSNILFGAALGWLWFKTASMAVVGWTHQWFDLTRDAAALLVIGVASSSVTTLAYSIELHLVGLVALLWLARQAKVKRGTQRVAAYGNA